MATGDVPVILELASIGRALSDLPGRLAMALAETVKGALGIQGDPLGGTGKSLTFNDTDKEKYGAMKEVGGLVGGKSAEMFGTIDRMANLMRVMERVKSAFFGAGEADKPVPLAEEMTYGLKEDEWTDKEKPVPVAEQHQHKPVPFLEEQGDKPAEPPAEPPEKPVQRSGYALEDELPIERPANPDRVPYDYQDVPPAHDPVQQPGRREQPPVLSDDRLPEERAAEFAGPPLPEREYPPLPAEASTYPPKPPVFSDDETPMERAHRLADEKADRLPTRSCRWTR